MREDPLTYESLRALLEREPPLLGLDTLEDAIAEEEDTERTWPLRLRPRHRTAWMNALGKEALLERVHALYLWDNTVGVHAARGLAASPHLHSLRALRFYSTRVKVPNLLVLLSGEGLRALRSLELDGVSLTSEELEELLATPVVSGLMALAILNAGLGLQAAEVLGSAELPELRSLSLAHNSLTPAGVQALAESPSLAGLERLSLRGIRVRSKPGLGAALAGASFARGLRELDLGAADLRDTDLEALLESELPQGLERLVLPNNRLGRRGMQALAACEALSELTELELSWSGIGGDQGAQALATSEHLVSLESLHLTGNGLTHLGFEALAQAPHLPESLRATFREKAHVAREA